MVRYYFSGVLTGISLAAITFGERIAVLVAGTAAGRGFGEALAESAAWMLSRDDATRERWQRAGRIFGTLAGTGVGIALAFLNSP